MTNTASLERLDNGRVTLRLRYQFDTVTFYWEFCNVSELLHFLHDLAMISDNDTRQLRPAAIGLLMKFPRRDPQTLPTLARSVDAFIKQSYPEYTWCNQLREDVYLAAREADRG
jgi:hypothetical protein